MDMRRVGEREEMEVRVRGQERGIKGDGHAGQERGVKVELVEDGGGAVEDGRGRKRSASVMSQASQMSSKRPKSMIH